MLHIKNLSFSAGDKNLYTNVSFDIFQDDHCVLIGGNGAGKTTLINLIRNPEKYTFQGEIKNRFKTIGYIDQFALNAYDKDTSVYEFIACDILKTKKNIREIEEKMSSEAENIDMLLQNYQYKLDDYEKLGGDKYFYILDSSLHKANISYLKNFLLQDISGGELKLVQLLKEMLNFPDIIIMDEPDAFLDFENIKSLEILINSYKKTLLLVTHNRHILNHCCNRILHLENKKIKSFNGSFIMYNYDNLSKKISEQKFAMRDSREIERNEEIIEFLREITKKNSDQKRGRTLRARVKTLDRLKINKQKSPYVDINKIKFNITSTNKKPNNILTIKNYSKRFDNILFDSVNMEISPYDKIAIIGKNGSGKTTLLRDIIKKDNIESIDLNNRLNLFYMSQKYNEVFNSRATVYDEFIDIGFKNKDEIERYLSKYNFDKKHLGVKIENLSGGEINLLQLAKMCYKDYDFLVLDEPTSHLDVYSQISLEEAINKYEGTILMVSHDYNLIANCMDYVLMIEARKIKKLEIDDFSDLVYNSYYSKKYIDLEKEKKAIEMEISYYLEKQDYAKARLLCETLKDIIDSLQYDFNTI